MPAKWKIKEVEDLSKKITDSPVVAVADIGGLPSKQMQEIRKKSHGQVEISVVKNRLARLAFEKSKRPGLPELEKSIEGQTALIFSSENPFKLYHLFVKNRVKAPAKPGQIAPENIVVPAGDTPFKPGPIIGDLQQVGIKAKIQGPIIAVVEDSPVIKEGEKFSSKLATMLTQLGIMPMETGISITAVLEDGVVYGEDVLDVDAEKILADIVGAHQKAINLAVEVGILNKVSVPIMITKAASGARNLAIEAEIYNEETVDHFLSKANREAKSLAGAASYEPGTAPKQEDKKEEPAAEKKEEPAVEKEEAVPEQKEEAPAEKANDKPAEPTEEAKEEKTEDTTDKV